MDSNCHRIFSFHVQNGRRLNLLPLTVYFNQLFSHNDTKIMDINGGSIFFNVFGYLVIALLGIVANINSIDADFVFDDTEALINNKDILPDTPIENIFRNDFWGTNLKYNHSHKSYRPLTILSFRLNYIAADGLDKHSFHLINVIIHVITSILSWSVFCRILGDNRDLIGFLAAILFAVHPVHTEAVCGVVGRADLLAAFFFFLSFLSFAESYTESCWDWIWVILSVLLAGVSMLCKEQGITVIGVLCIYDLFYSSGTTLNKLLEDVNNFYNGKKSNPYISKLFTRQLFLITSGILLVGFRCYLMDFQSPTFQRVDNPASFEKDWLTRVLTYNYLYCLNLWLLLCPEWLCFDWSMGCVPVVTINDVRVVFVLGFWLCFLFFLWKGFTTKSAERQRTVLISIGLMVISFLPASNLFFTVGFVIAERVLYIPSAGFCLLVACGVEVLIKSAPSNKNDLTFGFSLLVIVFLIRSYERSSEWASEHTLFNSGATVCPLNAKVHYNIAKNAVDYGDLDKAESEYREAIRLSPNYDQALNNLANILKTRGNLNEAEKLLRKALTIRHDFPAAWMNLGIVLAQMKRYSEAELSYKTALKYRRSYPDCHYNLGNLYLELNQTLDAEKSWMTAIQLKPTFGIAWNNLIILNDNIDNRERAVQLAREALDFLPDDPGIHFNLANVLGKAGEYKKSEQHFLRALRLNPRNAQYHVNLGVLYHRWKKYRNAMEYYRKALTLDPSSKTARDNYEVVKKKLSNYD